MSTRSTAKTKSSESRPKTTKPKAGAKTKSASKTGKAASKATKKPSRAKTGSKPTADSQSAPKPVVPVPVDVQDDRLRQLTPEQKNSDLLTQINLALGIKQLALFGRKGLVAARNFTISRQDCQQLLDWLTHKLDDSIQAMSKSGQEPREVQLGNLSTVFDRPPEENPNGTVHIAGSDMYTLVFIQRGNLWVMAALDYELETNYTDFDKWQGDLLALVAEFGL